MYRAFKLLTGAKPEVIYAPTLVISGGRDPITAARHARTMVGRMPNAKHLHIRKGSHFLILEQPERVIQAVTAFLQQSGSSAQLQKPSFRQLSLASNASSTG